LLSLIVPDLSAGDNYGKNAAIYDDIIVNILYVYMIHTYIYIYIYIYKIYIYMYTYL